MVNMIVQMLLHQAEHRYIVFVAYYAHNSNVTAASCDKNMQSTFDNHNDTSKRNQFDAAIGARDMN